MKVPVKLTVNKKPHSIEVDTRMNDVVCALNIQRWWQFDPFAAIERQSGIALGHRVLGLPVLVV